MPTANRTLGCQMPLRDALFGKSRLGPREAPLACDHAKGVFRPRVGGFPLSRNGREEFSGAMDLNPVVLLDRPRHRAWVAGGGPRGVHVW